MCDSKQRFSIRKYSFGAASVLLGLSFLTYAGAGPVSADTTNQPVATITETKTTSTDKASTPQTASEVPVPATTTSEATTQAQPSTSTVTSENSPQTSKAASSTTTSEMPATATAASTEIASTATSESVNKENVFTSETTDKTDSSASESSAKENTANSESTSPATATSEASSQKQMPTSSEAAGISARELKLAKAMPSLKVQKAPAAVAADDALSSNGSITGDGKNKGLNDDDVKPGISDANGASLIADQSKIPDVYKADPADNRFTFGVISLGPVAGNNVHSYNQLYGTNYYIRLSVAAKGKDDGTYDDTIHLELVDADQNHKVLWSQDAHPGDKDVDITALKKTDGKPFRYSYTETSVNGVTTKAINVTSNIGTLLSVNAYEAGSAVKNTQTTSVGYNYPGKSTIETRYIAKDANGNETVLATYDKTGRVGYKYTVSEKRDFVGYDLVSSPSSMTDSLKPTYKVGDTYLTSIRNLSDSLKYARVQIITSEDGTSRIELRVARKKDANDLDVSNLNDANVWKTIFTSEELKPGQISNTGNN
ncbi:YSIRK-type signal peptide-containing protein, partial [Lactobacillus equicursoris]|uniref:YSIRK-type signal peptide-containing protein n=1 Tax=Lactobacillus equicursoris TaxID=420645 RepID=UPI00242BAD07